MLDAASRGVSTKKPNLANKQQPLPPSDNSNGNEGGNGPEDRRTEEPASPDNLAETGPSDNRSSTNGKKKGKGGNPDPFERIETVARSSLAGSLKILSAAVGGVGEAVFQTGTVAEGLAGGAGQVAGERSEGDILETIRSIPLLSRFFYRLLRFYVNDVFFLETYDSSGRLWCQLFSNFNISRWETTCLDHIYLFGTITRLY